MGGWLEGGVKAYVGVTRCGKTTKAIADARTDSARTRFPIVTLDLGRSLSFASEPHAANVWEVLDDLYSKRVHPKMWCPASKEERAEFWRWVGHYGGAHVIVDEIKHIANSDYIEPAFANAVTVWGHGKLGPTTYYVTAQRPTFINRDLWQAFDELYVFRLAKGADAERMKREFGLDPEQTTTLERGQHVTVKLGFED